ncbi:hypothetical protein ACFWVP_23930 [Streptomyces sp. NPDC058637]|uniref:hypothetical protein n=1 Tax=Streptomyces sp. NPDC058637 TaxID=3346569 RepID=UPI00365973FB
MPGDNEELSRSELAAFELLIAVMEEEGLTSVNLRDLILADGDSIGRYRRARRALVQVRNVTADHPRLLSDSLDEKIFDDLTMGDLDVNVPIEKLIEFKERNAR